MVLKKLQRRVKSQSTKKSRAERKARECATRWMQATVRGRVRRLEQQRTAAMRLQASARGGLVVWALAKIDVDLAGRVQTKRLEIRERLRSERLMSRVADTAAATNEEAADDDAASYIATSLEGRAAEGTGTSQNEIASPPQLPCAAPSIAEVSLQAPPPDAEDVTGEAVEAADAAPDAAATADAAGEPSPPPSPPEEKMAETMMASPTVAAPSGAPS